jgi:hypothetical protein
MNAGEPVVCQVCGRPLKTAASRARGRGDICDEKVNPHPGRGHSLRIGTTRRSGPARPATQPDGPDLLDELDGAQ